MTDPSREASRPYAPGHGLRGWEEGPACCRGPGLKERVAAWLTDRGCYDAPPK
jgi:hypothetical protein